MRQDLLPKSPFGRLIKLAQEASEVIIEVTKLQLFGDSATDPKTQISYDNIERLEKEMDDLIFALEAVRQDIKEARDKKIAYPSYIYIPAMRDFEVPQEEV